MNKILYSTKFLQLKSTPSKSGNEWVYAHRPNASDVVVILPYTDKEVLFLIEERPPMKSENRGKYSIAFPAGLVGDEREGESIEEAIRAELLEESGLNSDEIKIVSRSVASSPGCVSETVTIALAYIKDKAEISTPISDGGIIIDRVWINRNNIFNWLNEMEKKEYLLTSSIFSGLYYLNEQKEG